MAFAINDRVKETSTTSGTGTFTLDGATTGFETFSTAIGNTKTTYYCIHTQNAAEFEVGEGTVAAGTLARDTVISSSNSDSKVDFSASTTKDVFCTMPASKVAYIDDSDTIVNAGTVTSVAVADAGASEFTVTGSPVTTTGTINLAVDSIGAAKIADGSVSDTEFQYINSLSSNAQTQITAKMTSFTLAGTSGSGQSITDGNTATVAAGNGITTTGASTDTVTVAANPAMTPYISSTGKVLVFGF